MNRLLSRSIGFTRGFCSVRPNTSSGYYILGPDVPSDTEENNVLLRIPSKHERAKIRDMTPFKSYRAFMKRALLFDALMDDLEFGCPEEGTVKSFDDFLEKLEAHLVPLGYSFSMIQLLSNSSDNFEFPILEEVTRMYDRVRKRRFENPQIHQHMKKVPEEVKRDRFKNRIVNRYLLEGRMNGLDLSSEERDSFTQSMDSLGEKQKEFLSNLQRSSSTLSEFLTTPSVYSSLPSDFSVRNISLADDTGPQQFLANCSDRGIRRNFFRSAVKRNHKDRYNNSVLVEEIRDLRKVHAKMLGFDNFLTMSIEGRMAGSVENIRAMINTLHLRSGKAFEYDIQELTDVATKTSKDGKFDKIELWDLDYYMNESLKADQSKAASIVSEDTFTLESTLKGFFKLCSRLFQVDFQEVPKEKFQSTDPSIRLFDIVSDKGYHGSFYVDFFARPEKKVDGFSSTQLLVSRSDHAKCKPLSAVVFNFAQPILQGKEVNLTFEEVVSMFGSFGSMLQHSLTEVPFSEVNGLINLEWDALRLVPEFLQFWPQYDQQTLKDCSTSDISFDVQDKLTKNLHRFSAIRLKRNLYKSALDLSIYSNMEFWSEIMTEVWATYMTPFELEWENAHLCSSVDIMCRSPASVYTHLWSKILAGDLFSMFQDNAKGDLSPLGLQFRDYFLVQSGGCPTAQLFKSFTERNPSCEGFLRLNRACVVFD